MIRTFLQRRAVWIGIAIVVIVGAVWVVGRRFMQNAQPAASWVEAALSPAECPAPPPRTVLDSSYDGPLIDAHIHIAAIPDGPVLGKPNDHDKPWLGVNITIDSYVCMMRAENTQKVLAFFPVWDPIRQESLDIVKKTMDKYGDLFVPFIMPPENDNDPDGFPTVTALNLQTMLDVYPRLFRGYGEIGLYARKGGAKALAPDSPRLQEIYPLARRQNLVVYFHLGEGHQASFEQMAAANRDITFIFHGDQLVKHLPDNVQDLSAIEDILSRHPNVFYGVDELYGGEFILKDGVAKETFLRHFKDSEPLLQKDLATWKGFIERHPDQVLWDSDRGWSAPWSVDADVAITLNDYTRAFIGRLDKSVQEKYAYKNAERILK